MKVLMINGSPHAKGNTYIALHEMEQIFAGEGIETGISEDALPAILVLKRENVSLTIL